MSKVVTATATMTAHGVMGAEGLLNRRLQDAMQAAVAKAQAAGVTDGEELRRVQLEARDRFLAPRRSWVSAVFGALFSR